jgi:hypothetical protein
MKRPFGLILSAIILGLSALFLLIMTAVMAVAALSSSHQPTTAMPHFAMFLILGLSVFYAILAVWAILTVIGILRLRTWARYSILIIGSGLACLGVLLTLGTILSRNMFASLPSRTSAPDPHMMAALFTILIAIYVVMAAIGIWWLIYFNLRSTRELFQASESALPPNSTASSLSQRPTAITILACFFLFCAACCGLLVFAPFPGFLLGFILPTKAAHVLYLAFALITALIAYGLLRLKEYARLATIAFLLFGVFNVLLSLLPWYQNQFRLYMAQFQMVFPANQSPMLFPYTRIMVYASGIIGLGIYARVLWLLHRHRAAFKPPAASATDPMFGA